MDYCDKWAMLGFAIGVAPVLLAMWSSVFVGRYLKRLWLALLIAPIAAVLILSGGRFATLILWNGIRPAICNSL